MLHYKESKPYSGVILVSKKIILACEVCQNRNYSTYKNVHKHVTRLEIKKFCKNCGKHTLHRETK